VKRETLEELIAMAIPALILAVLLMLRSCSA
jgi:hypothetical protein